MEHLDADLSALLADRYHLRDVRLLDVLQIRGERKTLRVDSPIGNLVVKITQPGRDQATVIAETEILAHLARCSFPAPAPVSDRDGKFYAPLGERFVSVYHYLAGARPLPDDAFF